jgi:hypothetical protein
MLLTFGFIEESIRSVSKMKDSFSSQRQLSPASFQFRQSCAFQWEAATHTPPQCRTRSMLLIVVIALSELQYRRKETTWLRNIAFIFVASLCLNRKSDTPHIAGLIFKLNFRLCFIGQTSTTIATSCIRVLNMWPPR